MECVPCDLMECVIYVECGGVECVCPVWSVCSERV